MKLALQRFELTPQSTIGRLSVDGHEFCFTLEDAVRDGPKVPGRTAIPAGTYEIQLTHSPRFKRVLPLLMRVPGFEGIRIHSGNRPADTDGCLLPGFIKRPDEVLMSRLAFDALFGMLDGAAKRGDPLSIEISNPPRKAAP